MRYRYLMHWYRDAGAPLNGGRALFGQSVEDALSEAASLWRDGAYAAAVGYLVIDTDDGTVLCRGERESRAADLAG
ncbi:MAG TPA: hypothetical protein VHS81_11760 [Caulobacteraceae bacterium]|jgi:hypothetical protein|nr:hypothetical protein [Caulobacteraceae bacterium]